MNHNAQFNERERLRQHISQSALSRNFNLSGILQQPFYPNLHHHSRQQYQPADQYCGGRNQQANQYHSAGQQYANQYCGVGNQRFNWQSQRHFSQDFMQQDNWDRPRPQRRPQFPTPREVGESFWRSRSASPRRRAGRGSSPDEEESYSWGRLQQSEDFYERSRCRPQQPDDPYIPPQGRLLHPNELNNPHWGRLWRPEEPYERSRGRLQQPEQPYIPPRGRFLQPNEPNNPPQGRLWRPEEPHEHSRGRPQQPEQPYIPPRGRFLLPNDPNNPPQRRLWRPEEPHERSRGRPQQPEEPYIPSQGRLLQPNVPYDPPRGGLWRPEEPYEHYLGRPQQPEKPYIPPQGRLLQPEEPNNTPQGRLLEPEEPNNSPRSRPHVPEGSRTQAAGGNAGVNNYQLQPAQEERHIYHHHHLYHYNANASDHGNQYSSIEWTEGAQSTQRIVLPQQHLQRPSLLTMQNSITAIYSQPRQQVPNFYPAPIRPEVGEGSQGQQRVPSSQQVPVTVHHNWGQAAPLRPSLPPTHPAQEDPHEDANISSQNGNKNGAAGSRVDFNTTLAQMDDDTLFEDEEDNVDGYAIRDDIPSSQLLPANPAHPTGCDLEKQTTPAVSYSSVETQTERRYKTPPPKSVDPPADSSPPKKRRSLRNICFQANQLDPLTEEDEETLRELLRQPAERLTLDKLLRGDAPSGDTLLHRVARQGNMEALRLLMFAANIDSTDRPRASGGVASSLRSRSGWSGLVRARNHRQETPVHTAARYGQSEVLKHLLSGDQRGVNDADIERNTPLHLAAQANCGRCCAMLLDYGASRTAMNAKRLTPTDEVYLSTDKSCPRSDLCEGQISAMIVIPKSQKRYRSSKKGVTKGDKLRRAVSEPPKRSEPMSKHYQKRAEPRLPSKRQKT